jgi:hypothetical protein
MREVKRERRRVVMKSIKERVMSQARHDACPHPESNCNSEKKVRVENFDHEQPANYSYTSDGTD